MNEDLKTPTHPILEKTAVNMLKEKIDLTYISSVTGFSIEELLKLKSKI